MFTFTRKILLATVFSTVSGIGLAQVGIGTTTPNADAELDITSTNRGLLLPRVALTATTSPAPLTADVAGMTVYNTATAGDVTPGFYYNDGAIWVRIGGGTASNDWMLAGNGGTTYSTDFLGTTDATDLAIKRNNTTKIRVENTRTTFSNELRTRDGGTDSGDVLVNIYGSGDDGVIDVYENNAMNHRIHGNGETIFNEQGLNLDFRIESDTATDGFFLEGTDGQITFGNYGAGTHTGTATRTLAVDAAGNIIEEPIVAASNDWALAGNAGTTPGTNYVGTSDNVDLYLARNGVDQIRLTAAEVIVNDNSNDVDFIVESDNNNALFWIDAANDRVAVNGGAIFGGTNLSVTSTTGNDAAIFSNDSTGASVFSQNTGSGEAVTAVAGTASTGSAFSATNFSSNTNAITAYFGANNGGTGVYVDNTFGTANDGTTGDAIVAFSDADGGFGGGWFINESDGGGTTWEPASTPVGILAQTLGSATFHAGVFGSADGGSADSASVIGQMGTGGFVDATGALGYSDGGGAYHGGFFYATSGGADHDNGIFRNSSSTNNETYTRIGSGSRGDLIGSWGKGDLYGMVASGKRAGLYVDGRAFYNNISTQIHSTQNGKVATYETTSTKVDITTRGNSKLSNGTNYVPFEKGFSNIISSKERVNVTITPIGESNGIHIVSVDKNGFTVKENQNGNSNIEFNWTAIGTKSGFENVTNPKELMERDYDQKLNKFLESASFYAKKLNIEPANMWWDGTKMRYDKTPHVKSSIDYKKKDLPKESPRKEIIKNPIKSERPETK